MAVIMGTSGDDTGAKALFGTAFADFINGLEGDDMLYGGGADDVLVGGKGSDDIYGGSGQDTVSYLYSDQGVMVDLQSGLAHAEGDDTDSLSNVEIVWGSNEVDLLMGSSGADTFLGWDGDDRLIGRGGGDALSGGKGFDTADYMTSDAAVSVNLATGAISGGDAAGDRLTSIEGLNGSAYGDTLVGNGTANHLYGYHGNDTLRGGGGADLIEGGVGKDSLWGGSGADTFKFSVAESAATKSDADIIKDFSEAQGDKIDLTAFGDLDFIGGDAFNAPDQARTFTSDGNTFVAINETGNSTAEMYIRLDGLHSLEQNDFIL
ncbi:MAG: calcium-binding protein [Geminicoccaceae bacterium]